MENSHNFFYHLQIAKCGGTYLNNMVVNPISKILEDNNIKFINGEQHLGWQEIDNVYTLSSLRDPVKRTVSHYAFHKNNELSQSPLKNVYDFLKWVENYKDFISNYQIKNFLYNKKNLNSNTFNPENDKIDLDFLIISINKEIAIKRIKKINILLKDDQLNYNTCNKIFNKILLDFNIKSNLSINFNKKHDHNITKNSSIIYQNLNKKTIQYLYEMNNLDSEIYFSDSIYYDVK
jgi:hypothetical protein